MKKIIVIIMMFSISNISFASLSTSGNPGSSDDFVIVENEEEQVNNLLTVQSSIEQQEQHDLAPARSTHVLQRQVDEDDVLGLGCFRAVTIVANNFIGFIYSLVPGIGKEKDNK